VRQRPNSVGIPLAEMPHRRRRRVPTHGVSLAVANNDPHGVGTLLAPEASMTHCRTSHITGRRGSIQLIAQPHVVTAFLACRGAGCAETPCRCV
jgi:hypothetical protein